MAAKKIEILVELEYDPQIALSVVENDEDLRKIFLDVSELKSFTLIRQLIKEDKLNIESKEFLYDLFSQVIQSKEELIDQYKCIQNGGVIITATQNKTVELGFDLSPPRPVIVAKVEAKPKKVKAIPRRYGREAILKDIEKQGGVATQLQTTALSVNDLKNLWVKVNNRLIKDMFSDNTNLTDEDYRVIKATIRLFEQKVNPILKKK